jgi:ribosomal protein S18 acetylase RimI-like enzyme
MDTVNGPPLVFRDIRPDDLAFVKDSWKGTLRKDSAVFDFLYDRAFFGAIGQRIDDSLAKFRVIVAAMQSDDDLICGWCCHDAESLHFIYVKHPFRRLGIARELVRRAGLATEATKALRVTHWSNAAERIVTRNTVIRGLVVFTPSHLSNRGINDRKENTKPGAEVVSVLRPKLGTI